MEISLIFDGQILEENEMPTRELAIALQSLDEVIEEANKILNKGKGKLNVKVKANFKQGSFKVDMKIYQDLKDKISDLLLSSGVEQILNAKDLIELVFFGVVSLGAVVKFLKGSSPTKIVKRSDKEYEIYKEDEKLLVSKEVLELCKNYRLRKSLEGLVEPLKTEGIDNLGIIAKYGKEQKICSIEKKEIGYFECPRPEKSKLDEDIILETRVNIISLSFKENNKWFINDGQSSFYAIIEDEEFLAKIDSNEIEFAKGDILKVKIRREQFYCPDNKKLLVENYIIKVLDVQKPHKQINLL